MYIVIWEIESPMRAVKEGKVCEKFDSKEDADKKAKNLKKTSGEAHFFSFSKIEVLEVK